ncbi:MAG: Hsp70 family protein [Polyangiales bacterium]|nr:Hsp70 family protein [Myxococcales bacterium]MCB9660337.1 Hsp70 family protein [Sandaracinaceae bacterium]
MSGIILGIDLGTTNSVVAVADGEQVTVLADEAGNRLIPSVVSFHPERRILVGEEARDRRLIDARNTVYSIKRLIGRPFKSPEVATAKSRFAFELTESGSGGVVVSVRDETYTLTEISAFVLREVRRIAEARIGQPVNRAVITVPANFNELQRSATKAAGRVAGLEVARIINEPTAAALAYGYGKDRAERVAVFDLGGGTFDLTILDLDKDVFEVVATAGDSFLGGDDIDLIIAEAMAEHFLREHRYDVRGDAQAFERLRAAAEWTKCQLSIESQVSVTVEELAYGESGHALDLTFNMSRTELELRMRPTLEKSIEVCKLAMKRAGLTPNDIDSVIMVGGSTRVPLVRELVADYFGHTPRQEIDPDLVVAQGAALHAMTLSGSDATRGRMALGRVALKKVSLTDLKAAQNASSARKDALPKQPAFAPTAQVERAQPVVAVEIVAPSAAKARGGTSAVPAIAVGVPKRATPGAPLLNLDDPTLGEPGRERAPTPPKKPTLMPGAQSPFVTPRVGASTDGSSLLSLDDPSAPDVRPMILGVSQKAQSAGRQRENTAQFGTGSGPIAPPRVTPSALDTLDAPDMPRRSSVQTLSGVSAPNITQEFDDLEGLELLESDLPPAPSPPRIEVPVLTPAQSLGGPPPPVTRPRVTTEALDDEDFEVMIGTGVADLPDMEDLDLVEALPAGPAPMVSALPTHANAEVVRPVLQVSGPAPLLMDVTPLSLGLETVGGYCQHLIRRNTPIPTEQSRIFSTGQDGQSEVQVRICQGDARVYEENQALGSVQLTGLRDAARGDVRIEVTFILDASGTLDVKALDVETGKQQATRINLLGGVDEDEIRSMAARQSQLLGGR